jgi:predicted permease
MSDERSADERRHEFQRKPSVTDEVHSEIGFHVEMRVRELVAKGMDPARARAEALARFGDIGHVQSTLQRIGTSRDRRARRVEWLTELKQDATYAVRQLRRSPAFSSLAVLTLAIGIGATTSIFSAVNAVVLRALPYADPERIVRVYATDASIDENASAAGFAAFRDESRSFERIAAVENTIFTLVEQNHLPMQLGGSRVSADHWPIFGVPPMLGRVFGRDEETVGRDQVVVLSHRLWVQRFGADREVLGRVVQLNSRPTTIIGVMPASFSLSTDGEELWTPLALTDEERNDYRKGFLGIYARLKPGVTVGQATTDAAAAATRLRERIPQLSDKRSGRVEPLFESVVGDVRERLLILLGAVGLVLVIACGNVANLLLARGASRAREVAVRAAIGAGRARIVRQLLTESVVLGLMGGVVGLVLAIWGIKTIIAMSPDGVPRLDQARLDLPTMAFALGLAFVSALIFGLVPSLRLAGSDLHDTLKEGGRGVGASSIRDRLRKALVVSEVALSLVLLTGAGLLIRSAIELQRVDPGFDTANLFTGAVTLPSVDYGTPPSVVRAYRSIHDNVRAVNGVESAALVFGVPMFGMNAQAGVNPEGRATDASGQMSVGLHLASPGVFQTMGIPMRGGRDFTERDETGAPLVAIMNEAAAKQAWPNENAIGKRFGLLRDSTGALIWWEVVGIIADVREYGLREAPRPELYLPLAQTPAIILGAVQRTRSIVARTRSEPATITRAVQGAVAKVDASLPVFSVSSMEERLAESMAATRFNTVLLSALGVIGLVLAMVGIGGVISYFVSQRTHEIGLRMALGASPKAVLLLVVRQGMRPVVLGVLIGLVGSAAATRVLESLLYDVSATDPLTLAGVAIGVTAIAALAALGPARRAVRIDPLVALRE